MKVPIIGLRTCFMPELGGPGARPPGKKSVRTWGQEAKPPERNCYLYDENLSTFDLEE